MRRAWMVRALKWAALVTSAAVGAFVVWVAIPPGQEFERAPSGGTRLEDRNGELLRSTRAEDGSRARWMALDSIDADLQLAFVAVEDRRFWTHHGVDPRAVVRAAIENQRAGRRLSGASTITMQLVRLIAPGSRGWKGKLRETAWAIRLDAHWTKPEILEQYLNRVHLGEGAVGVAAATSLYFGTGAGDVSVAEAALLAGIAHAPSRESPLRAPQASLARRRVALARMRRAASITPEEELRARDEPLFTSRRGAPFAAPHFTTWVLARERTQTSLIRTSLDLALQRATEAEVRHAVRTLADRGAKHAAAVVLDNRSGEILAWVGSPDFWESTQGQTDMVVSPRQPGSSLKPFLFALAFDRGVTAATVLADVPTVFATPSGSYAPRNYDRTFRGPVRAREALGSSYNVPAVALAEQVGVASLLAALQRAGFTSLKRSAEHYGLGLALGNGDVTLLELANAYRALATGGQHSPIQWRRASAGSMIAPATSDAPRIASPEAIRLTLDILADAGARAPGFGHLTPFQFDFPVAVKTGTSRNFTDNWAVGVTGGFTVAVWVGNFSGQPMQGVSGVTGAGPLLSRLVTITAERYAPGELFVPSAPEFESVEICPISGLRATRRCNGRREWFVRGTAPTSNDTWVSERGVELPAEYADWSEGELQGLALAQAQYNATADAEANAAIVPASTGNRFEIVAPRDGDLLRPMPGVPVEFSSIALRAAGARGAVRWFVNDAELPSPRLALVPGVHRIVAIGGDGARATVTVRVER